MASKDILKAYEGSMAGPSMEGFSNIFQSEGRMARNKYKKNRGLWNMATMGAGKIDTKIGDWQAAKKSGTENVGDISGLGGFFKYALGSGEKGEYGDWAEKGRASSDKTPEKDFTGLIGQKISDIEQGRASRRASEERYESRSAGGQGGYWEGDDAVDRRIEQGGGGILGKISDKYYNLRNSKIGRGIGKVGQFGRDVGQEFGTFFQPDKQIPSDDEYWEKGGYIKKYDEGGQVPYKPSEEDLLRMASMQATNREEGMYGMDQEGLMGRFHQSYKTPSGQYGKMTDEEGNLWWKNEDDREFSVVPELNIKELPHLERAREDAEYQKRMEGWHDAPLLAEEKPKYEQGGEVPDKDKKGGEKSGWFPEGKFLGKDVPKGAGGLMNFLVMGVAGGGAMSKVASRASKAPRLRAASKPSSIKPLTKEKQKAMEKIIEKARKKDISMNWKDLDYLLDDLEYLRPYQVKGLNPRPKATMKDWSEEFQDISESMAVRGRPQTEKAKLTAIELRDKINKAYRELKSTNPYWDKLPTKKKAGGGMINGPDHESGGVDIEVEGGEYVIPTNIVDKYGKGFFDLLKEGKL